MTLQTDLFDGAGKGKARGGDANPGQLRRMNHRHDPPAARAAAKRIAKHLNALQSAVLDMLAKVGPMTDRELESLPRFADYAPSTIRKRRSELYLDHKKIMPAGERDGLTVWRIVG